MRIPKDTKKMMNSTRIKIKDIVAETKLLMAMERMHRQDAHLLKATEMVMMMCTMKMKARMEIMS